LDNLPVFLSVYALAHGSGDRRQDSQGWPESVENAAGGSNKAGRRRMPVRTVAGEVSSSAFFFGQGLFFQFQVPLGRGEGDEEL